jgi:acyl-coenzyme A thioesterase PaaI-like protein
VTAGDRVPLDDAIGLVLVEAADGVALLRLEPTEAALGSLEPPYLHGGALAACVDMAAWHAVTAAAEGDWLPANLRLDMLRIAPPQAYRVLGTLLRAGRRTALADVRIEPWDDPDRVVAVGRVTLLRTDA